MKNSSTLLLRIAVTIIGIPVFALCIFVLLLLTKNSVNLDHKQFLYPILIGLLISSIPFYLSLYQAFKLLGLIDKKEAFSQFSVKALRIIKLCAMAICGLYIVMVPLVVIVADLDDAPGLVVMFGVIPIFVSMVIAVFAALLQKLLQEAIDIKLENDLTV